MHHAPYLQSWPSPSAKGVHAEAHHMYAPTTATLHKMEEVAACLWFVIYGPVPLCSVFHWLTLLSLPRPSGQQPPKLFFVRV